MMNCEAAREAMANRLADEAGAEVIRELDNHLEACADCAGESRALGEALGASRQEDVPDPGPIYWAAFGGRVRGRINRWMRRSRRRSAWLAAAAAALVIALALHTFRDGSIPPPGADGSMSITHADPADYREAIAHLETLLDRASEAQTARTALIAIFDDLGPGDPLELEEALEALSPEESAILGRELDLEG